MFISQNDEYQLESLLAFVITKTNWGLGKKMNSWIPNTWNMVLGIHYDDLFVKGVSRYI